MNKKLILALAMALGVSGTALAANPFSDLPAGHWAYGAVAKLAAAGVVDGYPNGTFKGDKTMTRYEMAQIVAKALAKGAIGADDKLVSEFADELDNLGVRISKLEKNADNVQITGEAQMSYRNDSGSATGKGSESDLRTRLWFTGEVNDNWHYVAMLENHQYFGGQNESGDSDTDFQRAFLDGRIGSVELKAGRYDEFLADGNIYDSQVDGVKAKVNLGHASYLQAAYGKMADVSGFGYMSDDEKTSVADKFWTAELGGDTGNLHLSATYTRADNVTFLDGADNEIWTAGAGYQAGKLGLNAMYLRGSNDYEKDRSWDKDGWVAGLTYGGAESSKPGSWGLLATYYDQSASTVIAHTMDGNWDTFVPGVFLRA